MKMDQTTEHAVIKYLYMKGMTATQIHEKLKITLKEDALLFSIVKL